MHYEEVEAGQATFMVGLNMGYLESLLKVIDKFNPVPLENFEEEEKEIEDAVSKYSESYY